MRKLSQLISALFLTLPFLAGCHSGMQNPTALDTKTAPTVDSTRTFVPIRQGPGPSTSGGPTGPETITSTQPPLDSGLSTRTDILPNFDPNNPPKEWIMGTVYFGFDQFNLTKDDPVTHKDDQALVADVAKLMAADPTIRVVAIGHCDHYGSDQYNLALSDRRANTAKSFLGQNGALAAQTEILAYGKYGAAANADKKSAEAMRERRVDLVKIPANFSLPGGPPGAGSAAGAPEGAKL